MTDADSGFIDPRDMTTWSWNKTSTDAGRWWHEVDAVTVVKAAVLFSVVMLALTGNGLVVVAVVSYRRLRSVTNHFVVSLAIADLTVAVLVMPVSALFELRAGQSHFTWEFCYFWISCDVTCCTASILHLCVIAVERYLAIAHPLSHGGGAGRMSRRWAMVVIAGVWTCSAAISFVPIYAGWFADVTSMTLYFKVASMTMCLKVTSITLYFDVTSMTLYSDTAADCGLHVNRTYALVSSSTSFYLPLVVMAIWLSWRSSTAVSTVSRGDRHWRSTSWRCLWAPSKSRQRLTGIGDDRPVVWPA